jgi:hypothetical protein
VAGVRVLSIAKMRVDAVVVLRGFFALMAFPGLLAFLLLLPVVRDLPHLDLSPLRSPLVWPLVALTVTAAFVARHGIAQLTAVPLRILLVAGIGLITAALAALAVAAGRFNWAALEAKSAGVRFFVAALLLLLLAVTALTLWWFALVPVLAAKRLLATTVSPNDVPLPMVMTYPHSPQGTGHRHTVSRKWSWAVAAYRLAAITVAVFAAVLALWLAANGTSTLTATFHPDSTTRVNTHVERVFLALVVEFAAIYVVRLLWRRARMHNAIDARLALRGDPRRPILYLRSFQDDPHVMDYEWDATMRTKIGHAGDLPGPIGRFLAGMGTGIVRTSSRLEENLATIVAKIGPLVAIGAPDEPLPQLGAARAYFTNDTWQSAVIEWVDMAQLILKVAGPTIWIRWELETILNRNAWPRLLMLIPPSTPGDLAARWGNIVAELADTPWRGALADLDPNQVIAMRLLHEGAISAVTSDRRRTIDYLLAIRIMLYEIQVATPQ